MFLTKLFTPVKSMDGEEAKAYLARQREGAYTLLDVRQPWEYQEDHLPGAKLIPLPNLKDAITVLDPKQPTLVYCAIGGRSRVAAQLLSGLGFTEVYNLAGGIKAYRGRKATGPQELNLDLVRGDEPPPEIIRLAYGMEKALEVFYEGRRQEARDQALADLCAQLGRIEVLHQEKLWTQYRQLNPGDQDLGAFETTLKTGMLEGGYRLTEFLESNRPFLQNTAQVLEVALMLETQALDLYLRLADKCAEAGSRQVLLALAEEEKGHLTALGRLLDQQK